MIGLSYTGARMMSADDLVDFTLAVITRTVGIEKKYNPSQPRNAHGEWSSGGGGTESESSGSGGGIEKGSVFVGSKDSEGESISHPSNGSGKITSVDAKSETVTVQHSDGSSKTYAAAFAPQKSKFVQTGSESGKTHIANVKVGKDGVVTNKDDGKKVGTVGQATNGTHYYQHTASGEMQGGFASKHTAVKGLVEEHNKQADMTSAPEEKPEEAAKLTDAQRAKAVSEYAFDGDKINAKLREGEELPADQQQVVDHLDIMFNEAKPHSGDLETYRGIGNASKIYGSVGSQVGKTFTDAGYLSTSEDEGVAQAFHQTAFAANPYHPEDNAIITVKSPTGTKTIYAPDFDSSLAPVKEHILSRNSSYTVESDEMKTVSGQFGSVPVRHITLKVNGDGSESSASEAHPVSEEVSKPAAVTEAPAWTKTGGGVKLDDVDVKSSGDIVHTPTGTVIGHFHLQDKINPSFTITMAHGGGKQDVGYGQAANQAVEQHNAAHAKHVADGGAVATAGNEMKPEAEKPKSTATQMTASDVKALPAGIDDTLNLTHKTTGESLGTIVADDEKLNITHADGTTETAKTLADAKEKVAAHHNAATGETPEIKPAVSASAPAYHKAGSNVIPTDVTVKKDGTAIHKPSGTVIGNVVKDQNGYWSATTADGGKGTNFGKPQKKQAVEQLVNAHNQKVALESTVEAGKSTDWSKNADDGGSLNLNYTSGAHFSPTSHAELRDSSGNLVGTIASVGAIHVITHVGSGATYTSYGSKSTAVHSLRQTHDAAIARAEGTPLPGGGIAKPMSTVAPKPAQALADTGYTKAGSVSTYNLKSANVQKDVDGKVTGSDVVDGSGTKIGYTKANTDGTMDVFHADGTKVGDHLTPGTGAATGNIAAHQNKNYGGTSTATAKPKKTTAAAVSSPALEEGHAGKFAETEVSKSEGGLHNQPEKAYTAPDSEQVKAGFKDPASIAESQATLKGQPGAASLPLTAAEKAAISSYTGSGYTGMNMALRSGESTDAINKKIDDLDKAFLKTPELQQAITTYRGIDAGAGNKLFGPVGSHMGQVIADEGYGSSAAYASNVFSGGQTFMRITSPKGSHVLRPDGHGQFGDAESELLIPRGARYKVMRDEMVNGHRHIDVVVIGSSMQ